MTGPAITSKMETDKTPHQRGLTGEDGGTSRGADEVLALCSRTRTERIMMRMRHIVEGRTLPGACASSLLCLLALTMFNSIKLHLTLVTSLRRPWRLSRVIGSI